MALTTPQISATQSIAYNNLITLTDNSIGSDVSLTNRRVYIRTAENQYLTDGPVSSATSAYTDWPYGDSSIQLDVLTQSRSVEITVEWYAGATLMYSYTETFDFNLGDYVFMLGILAAQTSSPKVLQDTNYYDNFIKFIVNLNNSENAILWGDDIYSAQGALELNQLMIANESMYF